MRAIEFSEYGDPEVLHLAERREPHAGPGKIRVRVHAAGINPMDWKIRSGMMAGQLSTVLPAVPGIDAAGVVDELGDGVTDVRVGDRVFGKGTATTAEYAVLSAWALLPESVSFEEGAALGVSVETAARVLDLLGLEAGATIVVDGAAGGVGTAVVQLAVARGLEVVGTASPANHDHVRALGATPTTYGAGLVDRVRDLTDAPVAGALDLVGKGSVPELVELTGDPTKVVTIADFGAGESGVHVSTGGQAADYALAEVARLIEEGRFTVVLEDALPWEQAAAAHARSQAGHVRGKLVLTVP
jgi:NADPH:quinone reductase-like Zn-dependent oxidoreductase